MFTGNGLNLTWQNKSNLLDKTIPIYLTKRFKHTWQNDSNILDKTIQIYLTQLFKYTWQNDSAIKCTYLSTGSLFTRVCIILNSARTTLSGLSSSTENITLTIDSFTKWILIEESDRQMSILLWITITFGNCVYVSNTETFYLYLFLRKCICV